MQQREFEDNVLTVLRKYIRPALSHFESRIHELETDIQSLKDMLAKPRPSGLDISNHCPTHESVD